VFELFLIENGNIQIQECKPFFYVHKSLKKTNNRLLDVHGSILKSKIKTNIDGHGSLLLLLLLPQFLQYI